jgi:hypothetical protein
MFYWKYCDIPEEDIKFIQNMYKENMPSNREFFQEITMPLKTFIDSKIAKAVLIQVAPFANCPIHADHVNGSNCKLALNIPLENCENSVTRLWDISDQVTEVKYTPNKARYHYYDPLLCKKITEFQLTKSVLFDTTVPHSVHNMSDKWRRAISLRFESDPWHLVND